ncbi:MAG: dockerin type I repeat-containing protein [Armatimonadetes bacterium]|nr:dockerin type I repeat-containing protein [Armatimonadota bacterium]
MRSFQSWLALAAALFISAVPAQSQVLYGDANLDGTVNVGDATTALQISVNLIQASPAQVCAADVSPVAANGIFGDKTVNVSDAISILQKIVGNTTVDPWPGARSICELEPGPIGGVPLPTIINPLAVHADTNREIKLSGGFKLQGTITGAGQNDSLFFVDEAQQITASTKIENGSYITGVPAGNYTAYFSRMATSSGGIIPSTSVVTVPTGITVSVTADTTRDLATPAMPPLFTVSGTVTAPGDQEPPIFFSIQQVRDANGQPLNQVSGSSSSVFSMDGTYSVQLPAGVYRANFNATGEENDWFASVPALETITVTGNTTQNLSAPPLVNLSGTVTVTGGGTLPPGTSQVILSDTTTTGSFTGKYASTQVKGGQYALQAATGNYGLSFSHSLGTTGQEGSWSYRIGELNLQADTVHPIQVPPFPSARVKLAGKVVGPDGAPITKGSISISSISLDGVSQMQTASPQDLQAFCEGGACPDRSKLVAPLTFFLFAALAADGSFNLSVPPGEYHVTVFPDPGFPVTNKFQ